VDPAYWVVATACVALGVIEGSVRTTEAALRSVSKVQVDPMISPRSYCRRSDTAHPKRIRQQVKAAEGALAAIDQDSECKM
jgi:hypothetical protein